MIESSFVQILLLLGTAIGVIVAFQRMNIPSSLGYLLVGIILGPYTAGPVVEGGAIKAMAEFGIVFLLFTIGLNFSLPQIHAMRHQVLGLGTMQVLFTTAVVGLLAWLAGLPGVAAFVIGAVFAQSSSTVICKQLEEQGEENSRHGKLGTAMSVFQDVTAVPFVVVIPLLATAASALTMAGILGWALAKAVFAMALVFVAGRWLLRPLFHLVSQRRSAELFTLTVLFVSLMAAWVTQSLGLSMAFGAFLAGMMLGETEFRHQIESTIRPFRDVLLGLFFVGIGMLIDPVQLLSVWYWGIVGVLVLLGVKIVIVALVVHRAGIDRVTAWRTALVLAVGGEFGFALLAIAMNSDAIDERLGQIVLTSVLFSFVLAPFLIRYNHVLASRFVKAEAPPDVTPLKVSAGVTGDMAGHVIICGYGRIGQSVGHFLEKERIGYVALDLDSSRVREAHVAGEPVFYGDGAERSILESVGVMRARLVVIAHEDLSGAIKILHHVRTLRPDLPVMVRTRDESHVETLRAAGATEVVPEIMEASLMIASQALLLLKVPLSKVMERMQEQRANHYRLLHEIYKGDPFMRHETADRLLPVTLDEGAAVVGQPVGTIRLDTVLVTALVRDGKRMLSPSAEIRLEAGDVLVLFGTPEDLAVAAARLKE